MPRQAELEVADVADLAVVEDVVEQRPVEPSTVGPRTVSERTTRSGTLVHHKIKAGSILAARAATEYVYVSQDIRRIVLVAASLVAVMFVLWFLIVVAKVIELPFY